MRIPPRTAALALAVVFAAVPNPGAAQENAAPGEGAWAAYDFVPGERVLYFEDFSAGGTVGPLQRLRNRSERMAVENRDGVPFLHTRPPATFDIVLAERLPERFTVDFDLYDPGANGVTLTAIQPDGPVAHGSVKCNPHSVSAGNGDEETKSEEIDRFPGMENAGESLVHCSIAFDGDGVRLYVNHLRALDVPHAHFGRSDRLHVEFAGGDDPDLIDRNDPVWISNIRVAAGGPGLSYADLTTRGRLVTHGILFDFGSDRIRPESTPTLQAIAELMRAHPDLRLTIEGHTDGVGTAAANQSLSERRAAAVKAALVARFHADAARLVSAGFGATHPVGSNDSPAGRQANRRVELVKM